MRSLLQVVKICKACTACCSGQLARAEPPLRQNCCCIEAGCNPPCMMQAAGMPLTLRALGLSNSHCWYHNWGHCPGEPPKKLRPPAWTYILLLANACAHSNHHLPKLGWQMMSQTKVLHLSCLSTLRSSSSCSFQQPVSINLQQPASNPQGFRHAGGL
jgi:hypothetical protein